MNGRKRRFEDSFAPSSAREWDQVRAQLLEEWDWKCAYCEKNLTWKTSQIDHAIPRCQEGTDHIANLHISCARCNASKGGKSVGQWTDPEGVLAGEYD